MPELWETADLLEVTYADDAAPPDGWWVNNFYTREFRATAQTIYFDQLPIRDRRLAPFVAPNVQGRVIRSKATSIASFAPAYVKPKSVIDPSKALTRRAGEPLGGINPGSLSLEQRFDAHVADSLIMQREMIERRWDWMACQATAYGQVLVAGEDYPAVTVNFGRHASLSYTLSGGALWDATGTSHPLADIKAARMNARVRGRSRVSKLVFGPDAFSAFSEHADTQKLLDNTRRGAEGTNFDNTGITDESGAEYMGRIQSSQAGSGVDLYVYSNQYEDVDPQTGVVTMRDYMDTRDVIGIGTALGGVRAFGAIMDRKASLQALPMFPTQWPQDDPSVIYTMTQSAPLMIPTNPNNTFRLRVLS